MTDETARPQHVLMDLLALEAAVSGVDFRMEVTPGLSTPFDFLYGGSGIAASAEASERSTRRPLQWITTQFLGSPKPGEVVDLHVNLAVVGRATTQTQVTGSVGGVLMFTSLCAHNIRPDHGVTAFSTMPEVPPPDDCPVFAEPFATPTTGSFFDALDRRMASGTTQFADPVGFPDSDGSASGSAHQGGLVAMWCRMTSSPIGSAATQSFVADLGPLSVCAILGLPLGGTSLDNTMRIADPEPSEWVLLELGADSYQRSVGHSTVKLWSQDGRLLGIAQQSALIRRSHHQPNSAD